MSVSRLFETVFSSDVGLLAGELSKHDRWLANSPWAVMGAAAFAYLKAWEAKGDPIAFYLIAGIAFVAVLFLSVNADFLARRVVSYRIAARAMAAIRRDAYAASEMAAIVREWPAGAPMVSTEPAAFKRSALVRSRTTWAVLLWVHWWSIALIYLGTIGALSGDQLHTPDFYGHREHQILLVAVSGHLIAFLVLFRWIVAEADDLGEFLITVCRDRGVPVASDAEFRYSRMKRTSSPEALLERIPEVALAAIWYMEDRRMRWHPGVDPVAVAAVLLGRRYRGGASTIAMQLARQLMRFPLARSRWQVSRRKVFECLMGVFLTARFGREWVKAQWLASVPFGASSVIGIEAASAKYLDKNIEDLDGFDGILLAERSTISSGRVSRDRLERLASWYCADVLPKLAPNQCPLTVAQLGDRLDRFCSRAQLV